MHKRGMDFPGAQMIKQETQVWSLGREDPQEKGMAAHFNILAWRIPWTKEPGKLQSMTELLTHTHKWDVYLLGVYECVVGVGKEIRKINIKDTCI